MPAGPAPSTTIFSFIETVCAKTTCSATLSGSRQHAGLKGPRYRWRSDPLRDDEVIEVGRKGQPAERQREALTHAESVREPAAHLSRRRERQVIRVADRKLGEQQPADAHRHVVR